MQYAYEFISQRAEFCKIFPRIDKGGIIRSGVISGRDENSAIPMYVNIIKKLDKKYFFIFFIVLLILSVFTRIFQPGLGEPRYLVFDERYYVPQALALVNPNLGHFPEDSDSELIKFGWRVATALPEELRDVDFYRYFIEAIPHISEEQRTMFASHGRVTSAETFLFESLGTFDHPPTGKWLIASGSVFFDAGNQTGWRLASAIAGVLLIVSTALLAKFIFSSNIVACLAGFFVLIDGQGVVMSRIGMLDIFLSLFLVLSILSVIAAYRFNEHKRFLNYRLPLLLLCAIFLGTAVGVKWQAGLWALFIAAYVFYKEFGNGKAHRWLRAALTPIIMGLVAFVVYIVPWFFTWVGQNGTFFEKFSAIIKEHIFMWQILARAVVTIDQPPGTVVFPLSWIVQDPGTFIYSDGMRTMAIHGNPVIWTLGIISIFAAIILLVIKRQSTLFVPAAMFLIGFIPWFFMFRRDAFIFYGIQVLPWLAIILSFLLVFVAKYFKKNHIGLIISSFAIVIITLASIIMMPQWIFAG